MVIMSVAMSMVSIMTMVTKTMIMMTMMKTMIMMTMMTPMMATKMTVMIMMPVMMKVAKPLSAFDFQVSALNLCFVLGRLSGEIKVLRVGFRCSGTSGDAPARKICVFKR